LGDYGISVGIILRRLIACSPVDVRTNCAVPQEPKDTQTTALSLRIKAKQTREEDEEDENREAEMIAEAYREKWRRNMRLKGWMP
jgi:hypothetical protein